MKYLFTLFMANTIIASLAQQRTINGYVLDFVTKEPLAFVDVKLTSTIDTLNLKTDFDGKFSFTSIDSIIYHLETEYVGYKSIDTLINVSNQYFISLGLARKFYPASPLDGDNGNRAKEHIKANIIRLILPGGFSGPILTPDDTLFESNYSLNYSNEGCIRYGNENFAEYNQVMAKFLDKKYGKRWRKQVRKDVIGLKH